MLQKNGIYEDITHRFGKKMFGEEECRWIDCTVGDTWESDG